MRCKPRSFARVAEIPVKSRSSHTTKVCRSITDLLHKHREGTVVYPWCTLPNRHPHKQTGHVPARHAIGRLACLPTRAAPQIRNGFRPPEWPLRMLGCNVLSDSDDCLQASWSCRFLEIRHEGVPAGAERKFGGAAPLAVRARSWRSTASSEAYSLCHVLIIPFAAYSDHVPSPSIVLGDRVGSFGDEVDDVMLQRMSELWGAVWRATATGKSGPLAHSRPARRSGKINTFGGGNEHWTGSEPVRVDPRLTQRHRRRPYIMLLFNGTRVAGALLLAVCLGLAGCDSDGDPLQREAIAEIRPTTASGSDVAGEAVFVQDGDDIMLIVDIRNASPGLHGVHIHETGDCSAADGTSAGGHWNPTDEDHGRWGRGLLPPRRPRQRPGRHGWHRVHRAHDGPLGPGHRVRPGRRRQGDHPPRGGRRLRLAAFRRRGRSHRLRRNRAGSVVTPDAPQRRSIPRTTAPIHGQRVLGAQVR